MTEVLAPSLQSLAVTSLQSLDLRGAVLFADDRAACSLSWTMGLPSLLERGIHSLLRLGESAPDGRACLPLPSATTQPSGPEHAIIMCSTFLSEAHEAMRSSLCQTGFNFSRCTVCCTFSERAHREYAADPSLMVDSVSAGAYEVCREAVACWLRERHLQSTGNMELATELDVSMVHLDFPLQLCPLGSSLFLLPVDGSDPLLESDLSELQRTANTQSEGQLLERLEDVAWSALPAERQRAFGSCAMALVGFLQAASIKPTLYAMGPSSLLVTRQVLQHLPASSTISPSTANSTVAQPVQQAASLVILDRSLDVVSPAMRTDHPLEAAIAAIAPEVEASLEDLCHESSSQTRAVERPKDHTDGDGAAIPPACVAATAPISPAVQQTLAASEPVVASLLDALLSRRGKEVNQQLLKTLAALADETDDVEVNLPSRPTQPKLRELLHTLRAAPNVLQQHFPALAAVEALIDAGNDGGDAIMLGELISHQKLLQHTASDSVAAAFTELIALAARAHTNKAFVKSPRKLSSLSLTPQRGISAVVDREPPGVRELVPLVAMFYSLVGKAAVASPALEEHEQRLRECLLQACLRDPMAGGLLPSEASLAPLDQLSAQAVMERRSALDRSLRSLFDRFRALAAARSGLGPSENLLLTSSQTAGEVYRPVLRHLLERAMRHEDIAEMRRVGEASIGSLFSRGANLLGVKTRSRITDHQTIIIFVLGGISLAEVRELRQLAAQHPRHRLLLGATQLASPQTVWEHLTRGLHGQEKTS